MNRSHRCLVFLVTLLALPLAARAERIERTFPVTSNPLVEVRNLNGRMVIQAWDQPQVRVVALRRSRAVETHFEQVANRVHLHTHLLQASAPASERVVDYEIWAPADARLKLRVEAGTVQIEGFRQDVTVKAVAASVLLRQLAGYTTVKTLNGSIEAVACSGRLEVTSISGSLRFLDMQNRFLVANTTSGDIFYQGGFLPGGTYDFLNHEGSIELLVPAQASFELTANSVQGQVINELSVKPRRHGRLPQRSGMRSLLGTVQTGDAMVRATSFSGTIRLRKR